MLSLFRYSTRKGGENHKKGIEKLTDELDAIIETEEDLADYGTNTEFDALDFSQEMFGRFYGSADKKSDNEWAFAHEELDKIKEIRELQQITSNDPDLSLISTNYVLDEMSEGIASLIQEYRVYMDDPDNQDEDGDADPSNFFASGDTQIALQQGAAKLQDAIDELKSAKPLLDAMKSGDDPSTEDGEKDRSEIVKKLIDKDSTLRHVMKIVGRLQNAVSGLQANSLAQEMTDQEITTGKAKFSHLVSNEKMYLADDSTVDKFYSRHINREQFMFRQKGKSKKIGGPITVLVDESSSMRGSREDIAKATAAALFIMATEQKRDVTVIGFGTSINYTLKRGKNSKVSKMKSRRRSNEETFTKMKSVSWIANRISNGGTDFVPAIKKALMESKGKNADILFITDGEDHISESALKSIQKSKDKDGTRIFTILLGARRNSLSSVSDAILPFHSLTDQSITSLASLMKAMER